MSYGPWAMGCRFIAGVLAGAAAAGGCGPATPAPAAPEPAEEAAWPPAGPGRRDPEPLMPAEWSDWPLAGVARADATRLWIVEAAGGTEAGADALERPIALAMTTRADEVGRGSGGWNLAAYRLAADPDAGPVAEMLWEALEPADAVAVVDLAGDGAADIAASRWADECPDPVSPGSGAPCLLVTVWEDGAGIPRAYRMEAGSDGLAASGRTDLDRLAAVLADPPCVAMDLRRWTARPERGLVRAGESGELIEGIRCMPDPGSAGGVVLPVVALIGSLERDVLPPAIFVTLIDDGGEAAGLSTPDRWSDGYELLDDLGGDGVREWLWIRRTRSGTERRVTSGPGAGAAAGEFRTDAGGNLIHRMVVAPPGGAAHLADHRFERASGSEPARVVLTVRLETAGGSATEIDLALPLAVR